jgi:uncharacterized damage-inducible protein DinB
MTEVERIADQLRRAHEGGAWHGPALGELLRGADAATALHRPLAGAHNIWEILLHIGVWESIVRRRLSGEVILEIPSEEDWPAVDETSEAAWKRTQEDFRAGYEQLQKALARLSDRQLAEPVPGMEYNNYFMLHGAIQHALYHAGQIALLKKAAP